MIKLSQCSRRNEAPTPSKQHVVSRDDFLKRRLQCAPATSCDSVDAAKIAVDLGEVSTTDFSDGAKDGVSTDGSDSDTAKIKSILVSELSGTRRRTLTRASPAGAPPGLEAPPSLGLSQLLQQGQGASTRLNSQAALFVPSFATAPAVAPVFPVMDAGRVEPQQLRQSIRLLKDALQQWESNAVEEPQRPSQPTPPCESQPLVALQEALARLSPQETSKVKAYLDDREQQNVSPHPSAMQSYGYPGMMQQNEIPSFDQFYCQPSPPNMAAGWPCPPSGWSQPIGGGPINKASRVPKQQSKRKPAVEPESLATHLRDLANVDSARVLLVRRINHLVDPTVAIKDYFSKFGPVDNIMLSGTRSKPGKIRPATLGFVVMAAVEGVEAILAKGLEHDIQGVSISVSLFQSHDI